MLMGGRLCSGMKRSIIITRTRLRKLCVLEENVRNGSVARHSLWIRYFMMSDFLYATIPVHAVSVFQ